MKSIREIKNNLAFYVNNPIDWAKDVVGFYPDEQQAPILHNYLSNRFTAVKSGHGTGKSCTASIITLHFLSTRPFSIVATTAPSGHQLNDVLWKEHAKWIARSEYLSKTIEWTAEKLKVRGKDSYGVPFAPKWHAVARTSRAKSEDGTAVGLQGFHAGPHSGGLLYVVDEASGVPETSMAALEGALTEKNNYVYMGGNPTHLSGTFYDAFHKDVKLWNTYTLSCLKSSVVDAGYAKRMSDKYGEDSDMYRVKVLGEFPLQEGSGLIPIFYVLSSFELDPASVDTDGFPIGGLDVALTGANKTILYVRIGYNVIAKRILNGKREEDIAEEVRQHIKDFDIRRLNVDAVGPGSGVLSHLRKMHLGSIAIGIKGGDKPKGRNADLEYYNLRAQAFWNLRQLYMTGAISRTYSKTDADLVKQLTTLRYKPSAGIDRVQIESKKDIVSRGMPSPDEADADMLCFIDTIGMASNKPTAGVMKVCNESHFDKFAGLRSPSAESRAKAFLSGASSISMRFDSKMRIR